MSIDPKACLLRRHKLSGQVCELTSLNFSPLAFRLFSFCWLPRLQFKGILALLAGAHSLALMQLNSARPIRHWVLYKDRSSLTSVWPWKLHDVILRRRSRLRLKLSLRRASAATIGTSWPIHCGQSPNNDSSAQSAGSQEFAT